MAGPSIYPIERELTPGRAWLVTGPRGRPCVAKRLPDGCLHRGKLHPHVRQRLLRLRELPLTCCGDLIGVDRDAGADYLLRTFVPGRTLDQLAPREREAAVVRVGQIVRAVHGFGLVHGAVHERNVVIAGDGTVHLIDPGPLLHDDFDADLRALERLGGLSPAPLATDDARADRRLALAGAAALTLGASLAAAGGIWWLRG
jgi:hypothetical protein